jgi:glutathione synthase/RimK-type ligase-like ATP-grasp enzyme
VILVCGGIADSVTELVCARLNDCGYPYRFLDLGTYPEGYLIKWHWNGTGPHGFIDAPEWKLDLDELTGVYFRFLGAEARSPVPNVAPEMVPPIHLEYDAGLMMLLEDLSCPVVNRIDGGMSNNSKVYQALIIRQFGLRTPPTLVTSDPAAARRFYEEYDGKIIYKSLSGIRSIVKRLQPENFERLSLLSNGPAQFQALIPGENVRVHTVGDQLFATRVHSDVVDYRYASREGGEVVMEATTLPDEIAESCLQLAQHLDLLFAGIDLKVTPDGEYYCFEVNPCPGFLYYEKSGGQPISLALANLLRDGPKAATPSQILNSSN